MLFIQFELHLHTEQSLQAVHCALRWLFNRESSSHSILAGILAGNSLFFYKNVTIILYLMWKTLETMYHEGVNSGLLPVIPAFNIILYCISTGILFHAGKLDRVYKQHFSSLMRLQVFPSFHSSCSRAP